MMTTRIRAQTPFLPSLAVRHSPDIPVGGVIGDFLLDIETDEASFPQTHAFGIEIRRVAGGQYVPGSLDYPRCTQRYAGPRPGLRYELATVRHRPSGGSSLWISDKVPPESFYFKSLLQSLLTRAAAATGSALVHSGLIGWKGRGMLAVGPSGSGKSSLCLFCALCGASFVSDDMVLLARDAEGFSGRAFRAYSLLRPATRDALPQALREQTRPVNAEEGRKWLLSLESLGPQAVTRYPINAVVLPRLGEVAAHEPGFALVELQRSTALARLLACVDTGVFLPGLDAERATISALTVAAAQGLPCYELVMSPHFLADPQRCAERFLDALDERLAAVS